MPALLTNYKTWLPACSVVLCHPWAKPAVSEMHLYLNIHHPPHLCVWDLHHSPDGTALCPSQCTPGSWWKPWELKATKIKLSHWENAHVSSKRGPSLGPLSHAFPLSACLPPWSGWIISPRAPYRAVRLYYIPKAKSPTCWNHHTVSQSKCFLLLLISGVCED